VLTPEQQEALTRVGPGTAMGELLRRYRHPVVRSQPRSVCGAAGRGRGFHRSGCLHFLIERRAAANQFTGAAQRAAREGVGYRICTHANGWRGRSNESALFAAGNRAKIVRTQNGKQREIRLKLDDLVNKGDMKQNVGLQPGDVLVVPESRF